MSSLLRKLLLHAMKFLGLCLLNYILMSCYIEIGHDKGWPKAACLHVLALPQIRRPYQLGSDA